MQDLTLRPIGPSVLRITQEEQHKEKPKADDPFGRPPYQDNTRLFSVMSYIPLLWLVGLLADPHNEKVRYHVNQGIIFNIFILALAIALSILKSVLLAITSVFWIIIGLLQVAAFIAIAAYFCIGVYNAYRGIQRPLPFIGSLFRVIR